MSVVCLLCLEDGMHAVPVALVRYRGKYIREGAGRRGRRIES